jgi:hypothetical protein
MEHLAGVPIEKWEDPNPKRQLQAAAAGRRVVVTTEGGIAVQIARYHNWLRKVMAYALLHANFA